MTNPDTARKDAADWLSAYLDGMPGPGGGLGPYRRAGGLLIAELHDRYAAVITPHGDGQRLQLLGLTATSTEGIAAACRNWIAQVRKKPEAA